jgi:hypothetical protein
LTAYNPNFPGSLRGRFLRNAGKDAEHWSSRFSGVVLLDRNEGQQRFAAFDKETWTLRLHAKDTKSWPWQVIAVEVPLRIIIERRLKTRCVAAI